jgi:hypothetical protein
MLSDRPILIVGSPRSGTTLLRSILDAHPNIFCPEWESGVFIALDPMLSGDIRKVLEKSPNFPLTRGDLVDWARAAVEDLFGRFAAQCGKTRWAEKTPAHVLHIPLMHEVFPKAQFLHIIRNGYDVVKSLKNRSWAPKWALQRIRWSVRTWVDCVRAGQAAGRELPAGQYRELRYEELIGEPERVVRGVCNFLDEPFAPDMLNFHQPEKNSWKAASEPLKSKPLNRYRELGLLERIVFRQQAGALMHELGYS